MYVLTGKIIQVVRMKKKHRPNFECAPYKFDLTLKTSTGFLAVVQFYHCVKHVDGYSKVAVYATPCGCRLN